ncbi:MAG TPA: c-type cytochrome biogenesis protein CcmI [Burkholderiales bacterium]|nr:c-type cytochrome biogenesis protein CcmI [Burkholderiales bacterium]
MIVFWLVGAALAAAALALVLRPLVLKKKNPGISRSEANVSIYRNQLRELEADLAGGRLAADDYQRARAELEARLLEDVADESVPRRGASRPLTLIVALAVPLCAAALYFAVGNPSAIDSPAVQLETLVQRLAAHLRENPDDAAGWKLLARSYASLERYPEAADAYAKAAVRAPRDAQLLTDFAESLAMARGRRLDGEPEQLIARALELEPRNLKALALAGTAAFARGNYAAAAAQWEKMLPLVPADSEDARSIRASIDEAKGMAGKRQLRGRVSLSSKVKAKAAPDDTVFIFARAAEGPPMPLAVLRRRVRDLPLEFSLDDSMAMAPGMRLSGFPRVVVAARVSKSGDAAPKAGDLQGSSAPVANDAEDVDVVISEVLR